jgi:hypothetical protein
MNNDTQEFRDALMSSSHGLLLDLILEKDNDYLFDAYDKIERYWLEQFRDFHHVHLVLLSEAPLFGESQSYFYNPKAGATMFFNYNGYNIAFESYGSRLPSTGNILVRKPLLLNALRELGVLVLDIFPFALNDSMSINYGILTDRGRTELFQSTAPYYFRRKMSLVLQKATPRTLFVFRYERVRLACGKLVQTEMAGFKIDSFRLASESVGGRGGVIRRDCLRAMYEMATAIS